MTKRTLFVHIGVHRTATSSIQAYLEDNFEALIPQGFLLPYASGRHVGLANQLFDGTRKPDEVARDLAARADSKPGPIHSIIVSDEDIALRERLDPFAAMRDAFDVKIVVSLRRQDLWLESWYFQNIKWQWDETLAHLTFDEFLDRAEADEFHWIDYDRYLGQLEADFGRENVLVNVFERGQMPNGPVAAFAAAVGIDTGPLSEAPHRNASLSPLMAEFVRRLPLDTARPRLRNMVEQAFITVDRTMEKSPEEASGLLLSPERRRAVLDRYAEGNSAVAQRYLGRDTLFFDPLPPEDAVLGRLALPETSEDLMTRMIEPVMEDLLRRVGLLMEWPK